MKIKISGCKATLKEVRVKSEAARQLIVNLKSQALEKELIAVTPIDTGVAKAGWRREKTPLGYDIKNDVPYVQRLNQGSSKQAPRYFIEQTALKYGTPKGAIVEFSK